MALFVHTPLIAQKYRVVPQLGGTGPLQIIPSKVKKYKCPPPQPTSESLREANEKQIRLLVQSATKKRLTYLV